MAKRGPYHCRHITRDRRAYDRMYYAKNREKILQRKRMLSKIKRGEQC